MKKAIYNKATGEAIFVDFETSDFNVVDPETGLSVPVFITETALEIVKLNILEEVKTEELSAEIDILANVSKLSRIEKWCSLDNLMQIAKMLNSQDPQLIEHAENIIRVRSQIIKALKGHDSHVKMVIKDFLKTVSNNNPIIFDLTSFSDSVIVDITDRLCNLVSYNQKFNYSDVEDLLTQIISDVNIILVANNEKGNVFAERYVNKLFDMTEVSIKVAVDIMKGSIEAQKSQQRQRYLEIDAGRTATVCKHDRKIVTERPVNYDE